MRFNILSVAGLAVMYLAPAIAGYAIASPEEEERGVAFSRKDMRTLHRLEEAFEAVQAVPEDVCQKGDDAARQWIKEHYRPRPEPADKALEKRIPGWDIAQCAMELAEFLPVGRAKKLVELIGGWRKTAQKLLEAIKDKKKRRGAIKELIDIIIGIPSLKKECWDDFRN